MDITTLSADSGMLCEAGKPKRLAFFNGRPLMLFGTCDAPVWYDADALARSVLQNNALHDATLPASLPLEEEPADALATLLVYEKFIVLDLLLGYPQSALIGRAGTAETLSALVARVADKGLRFASVQEAKDLILRAREAVQSTITANVQSAEQTLRIEALQARVDATISIDTLSSLPATSELSATIASTPDNVITPLPDDALQKLLNAAPTSTSPLTPKAHRWPFKDMQPGDYIMFPSHQTKAAQSAVHAYGYKCGATFSTKRQKDGRLLVVCLTRKGKAQLNQENNT